MCLKNFGISRILNCVRKICGLAGVTYYKKICVVCGACCCASMASLICADGCSAAVAAFACITHISIVSAIYLLLFCSLLPKLLVYWYCAFDVNMQRYCFCTVCRELFLTNMLQNITIYQPSDVQYRLQMSYRLDLYC